MRKKYCLGLGALIGVLGLALVWTASAHSQRTKPAEEAGLAKGIAKRAGLKEADVNKVLQAMGPAVRDELTRGRTVTIQGLGTFRVVRIAEHKDMILGGRSGGTPVVVPGVNSVEFLAAGEVVSAANAPGAVPAEVVPPFEYVPLPGQTPGQKMGRTRVPSSRQP